MHLDQILICFRVRFPNSDCGVMKGCGRGDVDMVSGQGEVDKGMWTRGQGEVD